MALLSSALDCGKNAAGVACVCEYVCEYVCVHVFAYLRTYVWSARWGYKNSRSEF